MGWKVTIGAAVLREAELTAGQYETLYVLANEGLPHLEHEVRPSHCPSCRNAAAVVAVASYDPELGIDGARLLVAAMPAGDVLDSVTIEAEPQQVEA